VEAGNCKKLDDCEKIKIILSKDMLEYQYADGIRKTCAVCKQKEV
jgi:hypothetical protein